MVDKEEITKTPSPLNINEAIEGDALNQKTARSKYEDTKKILCEEHRFSL